MDAHLTVVAAHAIAVDAEHRLIHTAPRLTRAIVHADPHTDDGMDHHANITPPPGTRRRLRVAL